MQPLILDHLNTCSLIIIWTDISWRKSLLSALPGTWPTFVADFFWKFSPKLWLSPVRLVLMYNCISVSAIMPSIGHVVDQQYLPTLSLMSYSPYFSSKSDCIFLHQTLPYPCVEEMSRATTLRLSHLGIRTRTQEEVSACGQSLWMRANKSTWHLISLLWMGRMIWWRFMMRMQKDNEVSLVASAEMKVLWRVFCFVCFFVFLSFLFPFFFFFFFFFVFSAELEF